MAWYRVTVPHSSGAQSTVDVKANTAADAKEKGLRKARGVLGRIDERLGNGRHDADSIRVTRI